MASKIAKRIIPAAIKEFSDHGYYGTTTKEIAHASDVAESSLFLVFGKKEQVFEEALRQIVHGQMSPKQFEELLSRDGDFDDVFRAAIRKWYSGVGLIYARLAMFAALETPKLARSVIYTRVHDLIRKLADAIDRHHGRRCGSKRSYVAAQNFMFGLFYFRLTRTVMNGDAKHHGLTEREYVQAAIANFLDCAAHPTT
jgi:AcrR family transcriptional regulator